MTFLGNRKTILKEGHIISPEYLQLSGVPHGSILSPTLHIANTFPTHSPSRDSNYIVYANDSTQMISHPSLCKQFLRLATDRVIAEINNFKETWKIKTNKNNVLIIPITRTKPGNPNLQNANILFAKEGKLLGLKHANTSTPHTSKRGSLLQAVPSPISNDFRTVLKK